MLTMTISPERAIQIELDFETDNARRERNDWQRAVDTDLRALQDYVDPRQAIVWQPGVRKRGPNTASGFGALAVHLVSPDGCTCQAWKLRAHCEHQTFIKRLREWSIELGQDVPVKAVDLNDSTVITNGEVA